MRKTGYRLTLAACYTGNVTQAIVNNLAPLLFLTFQREFDVTLTMLGTLVTVNFGVQLFVDLLSAKLVDKIGYRVSIVAAHVLAAAGLILLGTLPRALPNPFLGLIIAVAIYAAGGGITEVLLSPIVEACPVKNKKAQMAMLHSFYCWGQVAVVALSTVFFLTIGLEHWTYLTLVWAVVPIVNCVLFLFAPLEKPVEPGKEMRIGELFKTKVFWLFGLMMLAAGAAELTISQWSSAFAEAGLGVAKTVGDLFGPCLFALAMGSARLLYSIFSKKIRLKVALGGSAVLCFVAYLITAFSPLPALALAGCGLAGFSVGVLWPGVISLASVECPRGGTALFALLALAGDVGCAAGPTAVGTIADAAGGSLAAGLRYGIAFPILFLLALLCVRARKKPDMPAV